MAELQRAYVGLGSNLGDSWAELQAALMALRALPDTHYEGCSEVYRSAPCEVDPQPDFLNAVCRVRTALGPERLLERLLDIERGRGRQRLRVGAPRTLDLDLLIYGGLCRTEPGLTLPHPRMHLRAFVLRPLADLDPALVIPGRGVVLQLLQECLGQRLEWAGSLPQPVREACTP